MQLNDTVNLIGLKQEIYALAGINSSSFNQSDLNRIINKYYKQAQSAIRALSEDFFGDIETTDLVLNTGGTYPNEYPLPNDYEKVIAIRVAFNPAVPSAPTETEFVQLDIVPQSAMTTPSSSIDNPTAVIFDNSFFLYPIPDATTMTLPVTKGVRAYVIYRQPDLSADSDTPNIFSDYHDVITWGALQDIATMLGNSSLYNRAVMNFNKRMAEMKEYASSRVPILDSSVLGQPTGGWDYPFGNDQMS